MMKKFVFLLSLLTVSGGLLAEISKDSSEGSDKNICYAIGPDYNRCMAAYRYCFWDQEDGRCETVH